MAAMIQDHGKLGGSHILPPINRGSNTNLMQTPPGFANPLNSSILSTPINYLDSNSPAGIGTPDNFGSSNIPEENSSYTSNLTNLEAQRIMAVLHELQRKVFLIGLLPDVTDRRVSTVFGSETFNMIKEYRQVEQKYKTILESKESLDKSDTYMIELREATKMVRSAARSLTRHFLQNTSTLAKLRYLKSSKSPTVAQFEHLLQEIKMLVYGRLKTTVEEEKAKQDQLAVIIAKEKKTSNEVRFLKEELEKAKKERMGEINKRNEVIRKLKDELREIKHQAEEATKKLEIKSKQKEEADISAFTEKENALRQEIESANRQLEDDTASNREEEALLRKKKFKIESEVENWIHKYDQDMEEKQAEIDDITVIFMEEKAHLDELQERYTDLQKEFEKITEEKRIAEEKKKEKEQAFKKATEAATKIQAVFRGHLVRREIARKKNEKSGKKDKNKSKKK